MSECRQSRVLELDEHESLDGREVRLVPDDSAIMMTAAPSSQICLDTCGHLSHFCDILVFAALYCRNVETLLNVYGHLKFADGVREEEK